jgi:hypothetical protein
MLTQTVAVTKTGVLILARMLTKVAEKKLRTDLEPFFRHQAIGVSNNPIGEILDQLKREGLVSSKPFALTEAGRARALKCLGLESLPPRTTWSQIKSKYLVPLALGVAADDATRCKQIAKVDGLGAAILKAHYQLPDVKTMGQALDALVRQALDMEATEQVTAPVLKAKILGRFLKLLGNPTLKEFKYHLPVEAVKATKNKAPDLQAGVLRNWLAEDLSDEPRPATDEAAATAHPRFDLAHFASHVRIAARNSETGHFGDNKVFISHAWRALRNENAFPDMTESEFKTRLTEANHAGLLSLSRADLVEVMDPAEVQASETRYLHVVFHFIQV